jgi:hypothetical protein
MKLDFLLAYRADDPRVRPALPQVRRNCCRCGEACSVSLASANVAGGLPVVCMECLTPRELRTMRAHVFPEQLRECRDYLARSQ